jgi:hypothetical protein
LSNSNKPSNISDETIIIDKYTAVINKLIGFQQENRLLEGINKFSKVLPTNVRSIIKGEVIRLTSLTDASADNSEFAKFPTMKFKHFGVNMRLDKVGQDILKNETSRYLDRYTVGVFESIMNSDHYKSEVRREQQEKIAKTFSVESQSFKDIDFGNDLAIRPNFTIASPEFENGKACTLSSLSFQGIVIETKRQPAIESNATKFVFTFPHILGLTTKTTEITYILEDVSFNKNLSIFESSFQISPNTPQKLINGWSKYLEKMANQLPLERELEIERLMQNLERDRIMANSPWIPVFLGIRDDDVLCPLFELMTSINAEYNHGYSTLRDLPGKPILEKMLDELEQHQETFLIKGTIKTKTSEIMVAATHRQLMRAGLMKQFIELATRSHQIKVIQFRLQTIDPIHKNIAFDIHDMIANDFEELEPITHVLFCKDVSNWIGDLIISKSDPQKKFPKSIIDDQTRWPINVIMEGATDRRSGARYVMNRLASIKTALFQNTPATLNDISTSGMRLSLSRSSKVQAGDIIRVTVKELNISNQAYKVVDFNRVTGTLRLRLPSKLKEEEGKKLQRLFDNNSAYFNQRDLSVKQRHIFRFLWELAIRNLPCASILITDNRFTIDRLKTIYHKEDCFDLNPFSTLGNAVPLDGFFADKNVPTAKSELLENMLGKNQRDSHVVHAVRKKSEQIIFIEEPEFLHGKVREQISKLVANGSVEACVTHLSAMRCKDAETPLTSKRLAQISKIDKEMYKKLNLMQKRYTHVIYMTNVSIFHNALLKLGIYSQVSETGHKKNQEHNKTTI